MKRPAFFDQVKKYLRYLSDDYGFSVVYEEYDSKHSSSCIVILESSDCRIRALLDGRYGEVDIEVGPLSAPNRWSPGPDLWFSLGTVTSFLAQESGKEDKWEYTYPDKSLDIDSKTDLQLKRLASIMKPYSNRICRLFHEDVFKVKQKELEEFRERRHKKAWEQLGKS